MSKYVYNEHDQNQVREILRNRKIKRRKKRRRILLVILIVLFIVAFFVSDYSKIQSVTIKGNSRLTTEQIAEVNPAKVHKTVHFFITGAAIRKKVESLPAVKKATVDKDFFGNVTITVEETEPIAYQLAETKVLIIDEKGSVISGDATTNTSYQKCPKLSGFDDEKLKTFAKEYAKLPTQVQNQISDIKYAPLSLDELRCEFITDDGKILYLRIDDMVSQLSGDRYDTLMRDFPDDKYYDFVGKYCYTSK